MLSLLLACAIGPDDTTRIDDVQVLGTVVEPPEIGPGQVAELNTLILDPQERGLEVMQWTCTRAGEDCLEAETDWEGAVLSEEAELLAQVFLPTELSPFLSEEPVPLVAVWTLACEPGLCPLFEAEGEQRLEGLSDPTAMLEDLPLEGVSLSLSTVWASTREQPHQNPVLDCELAEADEEGARTASCSVEGDIGPDAGLWAYTTAGAWDTQVSALTEDEREAEATWYPGEGDARRFLVVNDGLGGLAIQEL